MVSLQCIGVPSAVSSLTPLEDIEAGPGNTETEAPELMRKSLFGRNIGWNRNGKGTGRFDGIFHLPANYFFEAAHGFLQLTALSPCFL